MKSPAIHHNHVLTLCWGEDAFPPVETTVQWNLGRKEVSIAKCQARTVLTMTLTSFVGEISHPTAFKTCHALLALTPAIPSALSSLHESNCKQIHHFFLFLPHISHL